MEKREQQQQQLSAHVRFPQKCIQHAHTYAHSSSERISTKKAHQPKSSLSQSLRMEFSSSVCFIENGAGRNRNHFHRIRIIEK